MKRATKEFSSSPDESMRFFSKGNDLNLLSRKTGTPHTVLCDMYNPDRERKLGYLEALGHAHITGDHRLQIAAVHELGYGVFQVPEATASKKEVYGLLLEGQALDGLFATTLHDAEEDEVVDREELTRLISLIDERVSTLATLKETLKSKAVQSAHISKIG
jgi:hypothetical protein